MAIHTKPLVLVVDADVTLRALVGNFLRLKGFDICSADSAGEAIEIVASRRPAAAVVELSLKGGSGSDVVACIPSAVPVIIYSRDPGQSRGLELFRPNTCLVNKPFSLVLLAETLRQMLLAQPVAADDLLN
jgi:DNA-binding response OmpR family regulator